MWINYLACHSFSFSFSFFYRFDNNIWWANKKKRKKKLMNENQWNFHWFASSSSSSLFLVRKLSLNPVNTERTFHVIYIERCSTKTNQKKIIQPFFIGSNSFIYQRERERERTARKKMSKKKFICCWCQHFFSIHSFIHLTK